MAKELGALLSSRTKTKDLSPEAGQSRPNVNARLTATLPAIRASGRATSTSSHTFGLRLGRWSGATDSPRRLEWTQSERRLFAGLFSRLLRPGLRRESCLGCHAKPDLTSLALQGQRGTKPCSRWRRLAAGQRQAREAG